MLHCLAKANADVQHNLVSEDAASVQFFQPLAEKIANFTNHVGVNRFFLHRLRRALRVHTNITGAKLRHNFPHFAVFAIGRHIINDARAGLQSGARNGGFCRVNRKGNFNLPSQSLNDWLNTTEFFSLAYQPGAGARGFAADIQNFSALSDKF